jgi:integrase/recombinase XerD
MKLFEDYIKHLELNQVLSFNSLRLYKTDIKDFNEFIIANYGFDFDLLSLNEKHLNKFMNTIYALGKSPATINRKLTAIHGFWYWLKEQGKVDRDPFTQIKRDSQFRNKTAKSLSEDEIVLLLDCDGLDLKSKIILELIYATGIRVSELVKLTLTDIDLNNNILTIARQGNFKERTIPFNELLAQYLTIFVKENSIEAEAKLFQNRYGEQVSEREIFRIIREAAARAGISKKVSPSIIRNSFLKHMKENGAHETLLSDLTGQKTVNV